MKEKRDLDSIKDFMMDQEEDLLETDLKTVLVVTGSYLYSGAELTDIEESVLARINELVVKHLVETENQAPKDTTIH
tara:strand:+ start:786 stop:1016 length:231 start_codon:yes stop_codon:yes gene_type:complete